MDADANRVLRDPGKDEGGSARSTRLHRGLRVLLVEDDAKSRHILRTVLEAEGITVVGEAGGGRSGVELAGQADPDVVLMDLRLPDMSGIEATRQIKGLDPLIQVVILTAYDGPLPERSAEQVGAYAYLVKGCSSELIRDVISQAWKYGAGLRTRGLPGQAAGEGGSRPPG
jgi:DNA-binding NarL/FixJ family response regulator